MAPRWWISDKPIWEGKTIARLTMPLQRTEKISNISMALLEIDVALRHCFPQRSETYYLALNISTVFLHTTPLFLQRLSSVWPRTSGMLTSCQQLPLIFDTAKRKFCWLSSTREIDYFSLFKCNKWDAIPSAVQNSNLQITFSYGCISRSVYADWRVVEEHRSLDWHHTETNCRLCVHLGWIRVILCRWMERVRVFLWCALLAFCVKYRSRPKSGPIESSLPQCLQYRIILISPHVFL